MFELDFLPVGNGNGDAVCLRYGEPAGGYFLHVIDGGYASTGKTIIDHIETNYGAHYFIHLLILSHADDDHASGLLDVLNRFEVKVLWMNRPWLYAAEALHRFHGNYTLSGLTSRIRDMHPKLVELERVALVKGTVIMDALQGARIGPFTVLAPSRARYVILVHYRSLTRHRPPTRRQMPR